VSQPNARPLEPIADVLFQIRHVHHHDLLVLALREGLVPLLIDALRPYADAVPDRLATRDLEGLVRPARDRDRHPRGPVAVGDALHEVAGHGLGVRSELFLDDADVLDGVEAVHARAALAYEVAPAVVREGHVEGLVNVADPMPEELERGELGRVVVGSPQDIQVSPNRGEEALRYAVAAARGDRLQGPWHVDEVFLGPLPGMIGPGTGIREGVERRVQGDQPDDFIPGLFVEFVKSDLADDLVAEIAPGAGRRR